jgi:hypothetical protein
MVQTLTSIGNTVAPFVGSFEDSRGDSDDRLRAGRYFLALKTATRWSESPRQQPRNTTSRRQVVSASLRKARIPCDQGIRSKMQIASAVQITGELPPKKVPQCKKAVKVWYPKELNGEVGSVLAISTFRLSALRA